MLSESDVFQRGMSTIHNNNFDICVIDFLLFYSNIPNEIKEKNKDFQDKLTGRFAVHAENPSSEQHQHRKWTIEILYGEIIDDVIIFNENFKSVPEGHILVFVCLDNDVPPHKQALLKRSYVDSIFFQLDTTVNLNYEEIFNHLQGITPKNIVPNKLMKYYPLLLHVNSISSGLLFNYYYSYLNRQISLTNNIFLKFTFEKVINREYFPSTISVILNTLIEDIFLKKFPSSTSSDNFIRIQSNLLVFTFDSAAYKVVNGSQTIVTYSLVGVSDFGFTVEKICIWQDNLDLSVLSTVQLKDYIREWKEEYRPCLSNNRENEQTIITFEKRHDPTKKCHFLSTVDAPVTNDGHTGISTMKKTTKDCYDSYISDPENAFTKDGRKIAKILTVPVYYIVMPSSCQFGPPDTNDSGQCDEKTLKGTIIDRNVPDRIQLAYANGMVLRSRPLGHYNRYLRRTFYYIDELGSNKEIIRYLFSAEYPYILSILDQLEKCGQISQAHKRDEYLRFCNMLDRLLQFNNLSESIKLIQFDDEESQCDENFDNDGKTEKIGYADFQPLWLQIKEDIDQWYHRSDNDMSLCSIETMTVQFEQNHHIVLFYTDKAREDQLIMTLIRNLKEKIEIQGYIVDDAEGNLGFIETEKQIIFICTGTPNDEINRPMMNVVEQKINKCGVLRDVFILVNDAIRHFPYNFIRSVPYLNFDLDTRPADLNDNEVQETIYYLTNMNVLSKTYTDVFEDTNHFLSKSPLQCTSIGQGCAAAFYFNYAKLISTLPRHQLRVRSIGDQLLKENLLDSHNNKSIFIAKWVFVIPWTIKNTSQLLSNGLTLNENEQQIVGFKLSLWEFVTPDLYITVGGVFQRSYSPLRTYKLTNLAENKTFYFPMEIPAALHGLQNQYQSVLSHFNFGRFDPLEQATAFRSKIEEFLSKDQDKTWHENIVLVPLDMPQTPGETDSITNLEQATILLQTLWRKL